MFRVGGEDGLRIRNFRPDDPSWAPRDTCQRVRAALRRLDSRLELWWWPRAEANDPKEKGRWAIMFWRDKVLCWSVVFYWQGVAGEYRPLSIDALQPILNHLAACDADNGKDAGKLDREMREKAARSEAKEKQDFSEAQAEYAADHMARNFGIRQTFAPGYIRRRTVKHSDVARTTWSKYLESKGAT